MIWTAPTVRGSVVEAGIERTLGEWWHKCCFAAPVAEVFFIESGQEWVVGNAPEYSSQAVGGDAEAETLLQDLGSLLEEKDF